MSTGTGLFLLGVWIAFAAAIATPEIDTTGYRFVAKLTMGITAVVCVCVLLANLYRL